MSISINHVGNEVIFMHQIFNFLATLRHNLFISQNAVLGSRLLFSLFKTTEENKLIKSPTMMSEHEHTCSDVMMDHHMETMIYGRCTILHWCVVHGRNSTSSIILVKVSNQRRMYQLKNTL